MDFWNDIWKGTVISQKPYQDTVIKAVHDDLDRGQRPQRMATDHEYDAEHLIDMDGEVPELIRSLPRGALPVPRIDEMRAASRTFAWNTGLGVDAMPPRAYSILSDDALAMLIYIL
eukprot:3279646-Pyramimonas_sp.AAC.1